MHVQTRIIYLATPLMLSPDRQVLGLSSRPLTVNVKS